MTISASLAALPGPIWAPAVGAVALMAMMTVMYGIAARETPLRAAVVATMVPALSTQCLLAWLAASLGGPAWPFLLLGAWAAVVMMLGGSLGCLALAILRRAMPDPRTGRARKAPFGR
ncbi:MAG: hypothetical protein AAF899_15925 [Pseudomonadota bacterium]